MSWVLHSLLIQILTRILSHKSCWFRQMEYGKYSLVDTYLFALFQVRQKLSVILRIDVIILCQPEQVSPLLKQNVFVFKILVEHMSDSHRTMRYPYCRRYGQMDASRGIVRAQASMKYSQNFRWMSTPEQCRLRLLHRNSSNSPNVHPHIFVRQHLLTRVIAAWGFRLQGSLPCQVKDLGHLGLVRCLHRRCRSCHLVQAFFH